MSRKRAGFDGATLLAAQKAFYEELVDFFRSRGRADRARAVETQATSPTGWRRPTWTASGTLLKAAQPNRPIATV